MFKVYEAKYSTGQIYTKWCGDFPEKQKAEEYIQNLLYDEWKFVDSRHSFDEYYNRYKDDYIIEEEEE